MKKTDLISLLVLFCPAIVAAQSEGIPKGDFPMAAGAHFVIDKGAEQSKQISPAHPSETRRVTIVELAKQKCKKLEKEFVTCDLGIALSLTGTSYALYGYSNVAASSPEKLESKINSWLEFNGVTDPTKRESITKKTISYLGSTKARAPIRGFLAFNLATLAVYLFDDVEPHGEVITSWDRFDANSMNPTSQSEHFKRDAQLYEELKAK